MYNILTFTFKSNFWKNFEIYFLYILRITHVMKI